MVEVCTRVRERDKGRLVDSKRSEGGTAGEGVGWGSRGVLCGTQSDRGPVTCTSHDDQEWSELEVTCEWGGREASQTEPGGLPGVRRGLMTPNGHDWADGRGGLQVGVSSGP